MHITVKKIAAVFLLVVILAPLSFMFVWQVRQQLIQRKMKNELETSLLQQVVIPSGKLVWINPGKEILLEQKMFDIKSIEYKADGNAYITGLFDHLETGLFSQLKKNWQKESNNRSQKIVQLFQTLSLIPKDVNTKAILNPVCREFTFQASSTHLPYPFSKIPTPPPQARLQFYF